MVDLELRNGRPLQTKDNVIAMLHNASASFHYYGDVQCSMVIGGEEFIGFRHQHQKVLDLAAQDDFFRCHLKETTRSALNEIAGHLYSAWSKEGKGGITTLTID